MWLTDLLKHLLSWIVNPTSEGPHNDDDNSDDDHHHPLEPVDKPLHPASEAPSRDAQTGTTSIDPVAEAYFAHCVQSPHADSYIDYPSRVYHLKPPPPPPTSTTKTPPPQQPSADWQSAFLWQPVVTTGAPADETTTTTTQQLLLRRRRPKTAADQRNTAYFVWFHITGGRRLGFRPYKDILLLDTAFLTALLASLTPRTLADPLASPFFTFLPRSAAERAKIKVVYLSSEPLRKALFPFPPLSRRRDRPSGDSNNYQQAAHRRILARLLVALFPDLQRVNLVDIAASYLPRPLFAPASAIAQWARLAAAIDAEQEEALHVRPVNSDSDSGRGQQAQQQQHAPTHTPLRQDTFFFPFHDDDDNNNDNGTPDAPTTIYHRALKWGLISPYQGDSDGATSPKTKTTAAAASWPRTWQHELSSVRQEQAVQKKWHAVFAAEKADPALVQQRYRRHRETGFSRAAPGPLLQPRAVPSHQKHHHHDNTMEGNRGRGRRGSFATYREAAAVVVEAQVEVEPFVMMYFQDKFEQAVKDGWDPGETMREVGQWMGNARAQEDVRTV